MALPTITVVNTGITAFFNALSHRKTRTGNRNAVNHLNEMADAVRRAYAPDKTLTITNGADASCTAAFLVGGSVGAAFGRQVVAGDLFKVNGTGDFTGTALATAKGSGVVANDIFEALSATTVGYVGTGVPSWAAARTEDFVA